jgi:hypothetical protein
VLGIGAAAISPLRLTMYAKASQLGFVTLEMYAPYRTLV